MFVHIWASLFFAVRGSNAETAAPPGESSKVTAEAGLCAVIPCYFTTNPGFTLESAVWYKCDPPKQNCTHSDEILVLNDTNQKAQSGFGGRVSLLEPGVRQNNCSIIISGLTKSDSGSYQLRVNGSSLNGTIEGFTSHRATVTVKDLSQRPTVMIPPLTEGQQTTLTCTAPGLCSGSAPKITWTWRKAGENDSHITGNITAVKTDNVAAVTQRHSSTLTFNLSAEHHGTEVTCKVGFTGSTTTEETMTLNVTYVKKINITGNPSVKEGETLNLSCSVESFPPSLLTWTKSSDRNLQNRTETLLQNNTLSDLQEQSGTATFSISNVAAEDSGLYVCTVKHVTNTLKKEVDVAVIYVKKLKITGTTAIQEGDALNLTCSLESFPPVIVIWKKVKHPHSGPDTDLQKNTGTTTLLITDATAEHSGQYICMAEHLDMALTVSVNVNVTSHPKILDSSGCTSTSEVLTCVCISQGIPLPTIRWPLLENHTEYSVTATVSKHTVTSTITLSVKDHSSGTVVECVSSNDMGKAKTNFTIKNVEEEGGNMKLLRIVTRLEMLIAFLVGILLSAVFCCLVRKCHRNKHRTHGNLAETLDMVTSHEDPLIDAGHAEDDQAIDREAAEGGGAVAAGRSDVEYSKLDFSLIKSKSQAEAGTPQETTETEYAEIKREKAEESPDGEGKEEEEEKVGEGEETTPCIAEEKEGEDVGLYSNVKEVMD
ncbi:myelin-associated glycoprotein isoform X2 [Pempheris klunzingeri]|uniref:myelin-associated glycoprotein isoform X2 n=1 Tax=Pempheris klunzingeri TaxID=3127111 RepID=UPI0039810DB1